MNQNKEGLTFKEWVCAAGVAEFEGDTVLPFNTAYYTLKELTKGVPGTSEERFMDVYPTFKRVLRYAANYPKKVLVAWKEGANPTEFRQ